MKNSIFLPLLSLCILCVVSCKKNSETGPPKKAVITTLGANGSVATIAGNGVNINIDGPVASAGFKQLLRIELDAMGNVYVTEGDKPRARKISGGVDVGVQAGTGTFSFNYVADTDNHLIRKISFE
jgi:hypothetical protein